MPPITRQRSAYQSNKFNLVDDNILAKILSIVACEKVFLPCVCKKWAGITQELSGVAILFNALMSGGDVRIAMQKLMENHRRIKQVMCVVVSLRFASALLTTIVFF